VGLHHPGTQLLLITTQRLTPGRYTLTLTRARKLSSQTIITIR
jgi:hypothetical protein